MADEILVAVATVEQAIREVLVARGVPVADADATARALVGRQPARHRHARAGVPCRITRGR